METYRSGHNENDSKSFCLHGHVGSNPTVSVVAKAAVIAALLVRFFAINRSEMGIKMIFLRMLCYLVVFLLGAYSVLRYFHLYKRNRIPDITYFILNFLFILNLYVCYYNASWISNETLRTILQGVSAVYLSILLYTPFFCFLRGIIRVFGKRKKKQGKLYKFFNHPAKTIYMILVVTALIGVFSLFRMRYVTETDYTVEVNKTSEKESLTIVYVADTHIGSAVTRRGVSHLVEKIHSMKPDMIILGGDIFDRNTTDSLKQYTSRELKKLVAKQGIYYVEGNQELRLKEDFTTYFRNAGITVLQDQTAYLPAGIQIVGLRDNADRNKMPVEQIMSGLDTEKPVIVISHRPKDLEKLSKAGADIVLCGHTHGGQYPLGFLAVLAANDMNYGIKKYDTMSAITTSGAGGYGIPSKLTVPSEIVELTIHFKG